MDVHLEVREELAQQLAAEPGGFARAAVEALAAEGVRSGKLTVHQAQRMLGIRSRYGDGCIPKGSPVNYLLLIGEMAI